jgi:1A family penicillin-binding protein
MNHLLAMLRPAFFKAVFLVRTYVVPPFRKSLQKIVSNKRPALFAVAGIFLIISIIVTGNIIWAMNVNIPAYGQLENRLVAKSTKLYDRSGKILLYDTAGTMRRIVIPVSDIPLNLINATVAIEDASFFEHSGIRPTAILRAILTNIGSASFGQGGSTITQQVVKNTFLTKDKSLIRKIKEWVLATRLEKHYTKNEIIGTYLNETPYGGTIYGVEEASREYFNKSAKDLTLSESAYLAALPKAPTYYSPWGNNLSSLTERHNLVLKKMLEHKMISEVEYKDAVETEVKFAKQNTESIRAPHFSFYVLNELIKKYGEEKVYGSGLQVTTTLDWGLQEESEKIIRAGALRNEKNFRASNAGLVAVDPKSGQVLAMVGSRDYFDDSVDGQVNVALALRQPGSAFKPIVYATAFKKGYTPETVLFDLKTQFSTACGPANFSKEYPCYSPDNYDEKFRGPMSMRDALAQSVNVVGVKTLYLSGIKDSLQTAKALGITTLADVKRYGLSLVLGGGEVTLLEITAAYGVFANDGAKYPTTPILSVRTATGEILESFDGKSEQVLDKEVAQTINDVLSDNDARAPAFGENSPLNFKNVVVANKTGTTNDYRDVWVIGYTPSVVVGTWAGNNDNTPMEKKVASFILAPIWHSAMEKAITRFPSLPFQPPQKNIASLPSALTGDWDTSPELGVHEILYWLNKDNPKAGASVSPSADPQLALWEYPVALWAGEQASTTMIASDSIVYSEISLGVGGSDEVPLKMSVTSPQNGSTIPANKPFIVSISHSEITNVLKVSYYLNDTYMGSTSEYPFSLSLIEGRLGNAIIRAVAESPLGDKEASVTVTVIQ